MAQTKTGVSNTEKIEEAVKSIRLKKARSCDGCRASEGYSKCSLGFWSYGYTPKEPCYKPMTIPKLIAANRELTK